MYKLSVIVPVYKAEKYLPCCLESIEKQTVFDKIQLILVDDGSPDSCPEICDDFAAKHKNVLVIHKENGGVSSARNAGLEKAEGEYTGFVDADDTVSCDYYEKLLAAVEKSDCNMAVGTFTLVYNGEHRPSQPWYDDGATVTAADFAAHMLSDGSQNSVWSKIFRTSVIKENKIRFPDGVKIGEDKIFILEYLRFCPYVCATTENGYYYMDIQSSAVHSDKKLQELLSTYDRETELFVALGLDRQAVSEGKSVYLFYELSDFLQRSFFSSPAKTVDLIKACFANESLMTKIDNGLNKIKNENGRVYNAFADAYKQKSVMKLLCALTVHKIITKTGERK